MSNKTITVRFLAQQGTEDLYKCESTGKVYARQPARSKKYVYWYTTSKWSGGYEASVPARSGITFRVVDGSGKILFEELMIPSTSDTGSCAITHGDFLSEMLRDEALKYGETLHLIPHEEWRKRLAGEKAKNGYNGMMDNWLYCETETDTRVVINTVKMLGKDKHIVLEKCKHRICDLEWFSVIVTDISLDITEAICGYAFIENKKESCK